MQQTETISCNNCGAAIELPRTANYVTCARCGAHLVVRRSETARYTEIVSDSHEAVQHAADNEAELRRMKIEMSIMALDQEWDGRRMQYMVRSRDGALIEPAITQVITYLLGTLVIVGYVTFTFITNKNMAAVFGIGGLLLVIPIVAIFGGLALQRYAKYLAYANAERAYLLQRDKLINERWENQKPASSQ